MKIFKPSGLFSLFLSMLAVISLVPGQAAAQAASSSVSVTPSSQSLQPGQTFTIQIRGYVTNNFTGANRITGSLVFPANLLQVVSIDKSSATLNWQNDVTSSAGAINFNQRSFLPVNNTNVFIASVTLKALANGNATAAFSGSTAYGYNSTNIATTRAGGSYTISTPAPATCPAGQIGTPPNCRVPTPTQCPAGQTGTPPNCKAPATSCPAGQTGTPPNCKAITSNTPSPSPSTPTPPAPAPVISPDISNDPTPDNGFSISEVTATRSYDSTLLNWKTNSSSKASVSYGTSLKDLNKKVDAILLPDTTYEAKLTDLTPGKQYYYTINAASEADTAKTDSYSGVFTTRGFPVVVTITENKSQISSAKLKIGEQNYSTDKSGRISLELASGSYNVEVKTSKGAKTFVINVAKKAIPENGESLDVQRFTLDVPLTSTGNNSNYLWLIVGGLGGGMLLIGGILLWLWKKRRNQDVHQPVVITSESDFNWAPQQPQPPAPPIPDFSTMPLPPAEGQSLSSLNQAPDLYQPEGQQYITNDPSTLPQEDTVNADITGDISPESIASQQVVPQPSDSTNNIANQSPSTQIFATEAQTTDIDTSNSQQMATPTQEDLTYNGEQSAPDPTPVSNIAENYQAAEIVETPNGDELQINHEDKHNSVYIDDEEPKDMFEIAKNTPPSNP